MNYHKLSLNLKLIILRKYEVMRPYGCGVMQKPCNSAPPRPHKKDIIFRREGVFETEKIRNLRTEMGVIPDLAGVTQGIVWGWYGIRKNQTLIFHEFQMVEGVS